MRAVSAFFTIVVVLSALVSLAFARNLPAHRGPLTPGELRGVVKEHRKTTVRRYRDAARRYQRAVKEGRVYRGTKYDVIHSSVYEQPAVVPKGSRDGDITGGRINYGLVDTGNVQLNLRRRESGKPTSTTLSIRYNPGERINARPGRGTMLITETRTSAANRRTPNSRLTLRSYNGAVWKMSETHETDGNGYRNGKKVGFGQRDQLYMPGGRAAVKNPRSRTYTPMKNKKPL
jgi:hypothetical protein